MKKFFVKFIALAIVLITTLITSTPTYAYSQGAKSNNSLESNNFTITTLSNEDIPENIDLENLPNFSSEEEAIAYMNQIVSDFNDVNSQGLSEVNSKKLQTIPTMSTMSTTANGSLVKYAGSPNLGINKVNMEISFKYSTSTKLFKSLTYATSYMTGIALSGVTWTQTTSTTHAPYSILDGGRTLKVSVNGILKAHLLINSKYTEISSTAETITIEFYRSEI